MREKDQAHPAGHLPVALDDAVRVDVAGVEAQRVAGSPGETAERLVAVETHLALAAPV